ncbi:MAG: FHA domain-containing protein [Actinomycetota bacterium]|nr:FHA domain-containing protein [Actinomycetota bacterium]
MTKYAIIGDGATGTTAAFYVRRADPSGDISMISDESSPAYYRAALTNYLMGELRPEQLFAVPPNFYSKSRVKRILARVTRVETERNRLHLSDGGTHDYDRLLVAAGARARAPQFAGADMEGVMTMRTMQDARFIMDQIHGSRLKKAVVVGGGILGLELVAGLRARDVDVTYVIRGHHFMPTILDRVASDLVVSRCRNFGVDVRLDEEVEEVSGRGRFQEARLKVSGESVAGELMIVAIGIEPNVEFLAGSGIKVRHGIPVDDNMRTNIENVFAGGDIAEIHDPWQERYRSLGLWEPAKHHGRIAGMNMAGAHEVWRMPVPYNATRLYDLDLGGIGQTQEQPGDEAIVDFPETGRTIAYKKLVFREERLVGALLVGQRKERVRERAGKYRQLIASRIDVSAVRDLLLDPMFDINAWMESLRSPASPSDRGKRQGVRADLSRIIGRPIGIRPPGGGPDRSPEGSSPNQIDAPRTLSTLMRSPTRAAAAPVAAPAEPPPPRGMHSAAPTLKLHDGSLRHIDRPRLTLGRDEDNDVRFEDPRISGLHAELRTSDEGVRIVDNDSRNGTFVNERVVKGSRLLAHGDVIRLGTTDVIFFNQVLPPRPETGPVGLPGEPLERPVVEGKTLGRISWPGDEIELTGVALKIGRRPQETQITLDDPAVSWLHAEVTLHSGGLYLRDLGSRNGTFVNGELVSIPTALRSGDVIRVGNTDLAFETVEDSTRSFRSQERADERELGLIGASPPVLGVPFALEPETTIGRDQATIVLREPAVSRRHARLERKGEAWSIRDEKSTNGTFVNGRRLADGESAALRPGDLVAVGRVEFRLAPLPEDVMRSPRDPGDTMAEEGAAPQDATTVLAAADLLHGPPGTAIRPARLHVLRGPRSGESLSLEGLPLVLGRQGAEDVTGLDDPYVSQRHAMIYEDEGGILVVSDLGSSNGTWVNEVPLDPDSPHPISIGTKLRLGLVSVLEADI